MNTRHTVKIFADGADKAGMLEMYARPYIKGFTTNPTLMRQAGVADYRAFAQDMIEGHDLFYHAGKYSIVFKTGKAETCLCKMPRAHLQPRQGHYRVI